jgi:hypothetical protein
MPKGKKIRYPILQLKTSMGQLKSTGITHTEIAYKSTYNVLKRPAKTLSPFILRLTLQQNITDIQIRPRRMTRHITGYLFFLKAPIISLARRSGPSSRMKQLQ